MPNVNKNIIQIYQISQRNVFIMNKQKHNCYVTFKTFIINIISTCNVAIYSTSYLARRLLISPHLSSPHQQLLPRTNILDVRISQQTRRWANIGQMLYKCFVFAGLWPGECHGSNCPNDIIYHILHHYR